MLDDSVEKRCKVQSAVALRALLDLLSALFDGHTQDLVGILDSDTLTGNTVKDGEIQLIVVSFQIHEEFINLVNYFVDPGVLLIQLVYKEDGVQTLFQGLLQYEPCLRHGTL